jgi:hypothetical protein
MSDAIGTGEVIPLFHHGWPHLTTLGALIDQGKVTPEAEIMDRMAYHFREVERLREAKIGDAAILRQLIVVGALFVRAIFEIHGIPKSRSHPIDPALPAPSPGGGRRPAA